MINTQKIIASGSQPFYFKTNIQASLIQITAFGGSGTISLKAATTAETEFENVVNNEGDTEAVVLDLSKQETISIRGYSIYDLEFIPSGNVSGNIIITQRG